MELGIVKSVRGRTACNWLAGHGSWHSVLMRTASEVGSRRDRGP